MMQQTNYRPIPYLGDNLDRLLDLLDVARAERAARKPRGHRALAATIVAEAPRTARVSRRPGGRQMAGLSLAS